MRVEGVVLEDHRHVAGLRRQVVHDLPADPHRPRGDVLEPGDHPQRRRLAAARRADEDDELAVLDLEVELLDGARPVGVDLGQLVELDRGHGCDSCNLVTFARRAMAAVATRAGSRAPDGSGTCRSAEASLPRSSSRRRCSSSARSSARRSCSRSTSASPTRPRARSAASGSGSGTSGTLLNDPIFVDAIWHTFLFTAISQAIVVLCAGLIAHALVHAFPGRWILRFMILLPWAAPIALTAIGFVWIYDTQASIFTWFLVHLHLASDLNHPAWLGTPNERDGLDHLRPGLADDPVRDRDLPRRASRRSRRRSTTPPRSTGRPA